MKRNKNFDSQKPLLYLVATPIGNLKEMSPRAIEVLSLVDVIAAEDTRNTFSLLDKFNIRKELFSLREHNENQASEHLINLMKSGKKVAYVSDAGYPGISDPGQLLAKNARENDINVTTICGSCAFINALVASGLSTTHFYFYGFLSPKANEAKGELESLKEMRDTIIFYESPHRILKTIETIYEVFGDRKCVIARELTKLNEEYIEGQLSELIHLDETSLKGEMVVLIEGNKEERKIDEKKILDLVEELKNKGLSTKDAIEITAKVHQINKNYLKDLVQK